MPGLAGEGDASGQPVLIHCGAADAGVNAVTIRERGVERLEHDDACALGADVAVGGGGEGFAAAIGREHRSLAEADEAVRHEEQLHPASEGEFAFVAPQAAAGQVHSQQCG